ncbi:MAG: CRTAC1 family protein [Thermoanaerobaculia bacterium]|nr:CRTAC1 family protein [Thermoanaerobaculia bacterium]
MCLACLLVAGCSTSPPPSTGTSVDGPFHFVDRTAAVGLGDIHYPADLRRGKIIATMGGGVAWGDFDGDGDPDLYVTQGIPEYRADREPTRCGFLFRNEGGERFVEVSRRLGLRACGWGSGALFEDVDADGRLDLFLTFVGENQLWLGREDGTFREVGEETGIRAPDYNCGAAFLDLEGDGDLDLYLVRYVETSVEEEMAWPDLKLRMPEEYPAPANALLRNDDGRFTEITEEAGVADSEGRGLGVVAADFDLDGRADLYVANDRGRNTLFRNRGDGTFEDVTTLAGVGNGRHGRWESAMGLAVGDVAGNGYPDILVTNYVDEPNTLFVNHGDLVFEDRTRHYGLFAGSYDWVGWATEMVDFDLDGKLDLYVANGHIIPDRISRLAALLSSDPLVDAYAQGGYRQPLLIYRGREEGFELVEEAGAVAGKLAARGGATADVDRDGLLDLFVMSLPRGAPAVFLADRTSPAGSWVALDLRSPNPGPTSVGPRTEVAAAGRSQTGQVPVGQVPVAQVQVRQLISGGSYLSGSARPLHFGPGDARTARVELRYPDGTAARLRDLPADHSYSALPGTR